MLIVLVCGTIDFLPDFLAVENPKRALRRAAGNVHALRISQKGFCKPFSFGTGRAGCVLVSVVITILCNEVVRNHVPCVTGATILDDSRNAHFRLPFVLVYSPFFKRLQEQNRWSYPIFMLKGGEDTNLSGWRFEALQDWLGSGLD
jgi:hypothetical protein